MCRCWEEREHKCEHQKAQRYNIDVNTAPTQIETGRQERLLDKAFTQDTGDGHDIRGHGTDLADGDNDVEGDCGADYDEGEEGAYAEGGEDGIKGNVPAWSDLLYISILYAGNRKWWGST